MNHKTYIFIIFSSSILSLGIWLMILLNYDPFSSDLITRGAFFASLFLWIWGLFTLIVFNIKIWIGNKEVIYSHLSVTLRQASFFSLTIIGLLIFQTLRVLNWWVGGILVLVILLTELFFRTRTV